MVAGKILSRKFEERCPQHHSRGAGFRFEAVLSLIFKDGCAGQFGVDKVYGSVRLFELIIAPLFDEARGTPLPCVSPPSSSSLIQKRKGWSGEVVSESSSSGSLICPTVLRRGFASFPFGIVRSGANTSRIIHIRAVNRGGEEILLGIKFQVPVIWCWVEVVGENHSATRIQAEVAHDLGVIR